VAAAALDVFETEPPKDWSLAQLPQVIATPHIAASTEEAQEMVGIETAATVRDFLRDGVVRNGVNFPSLRPEEMQRLQPWIRLADRLGALASQLGAARIETLGIRYYGALVESRGLDVLAASAAAGALRHILSGGVSMVNAIATARNRGIDVVESRSSRARHFTSLLSIKLTTDTGDHWVEGTVFEPDTLRLVSVGGISVEAPLSGTLLVVRNDDRPGVIGDVGTILGRHGVNIANFALGRGDRGAIGVVNVDEDGASPALAESIEEIRRLRAVQEAVIVRL
jgi:D-3-phosphoglycerate dehydrogenase